MIKKKNKGITLVALVITIIVLLVLAGITIAQLKKNGLLYKATRAKDESEKQVATEKMNLKITEAEMSSWEKEKRMPTLQELANEFCKNEDDEFEYVLTTSKKTSSKLENIIVADSIFTKFKEYPYEFEIDRSLRLASIDGNKVGNKSDNSINENDYNSLIIGNIDFNVSDISGSGFYVTITTDQQNQDLIAGYYVFCNGKIVRVSEDNKIKINNLEKDTKYEIKCVALDVDGKIKTSSVKDVKTKKVNLNDVVALEYPKLTDSGFKNCKDSAGNLYYLEGITNTGDHAATYQAFDGLNEEFYVDDHMIFDIDESYRGKVIKLIGYKNLSLVHAYNSSLQKTRLGYVWNQTITIPQYACRIELETQSGREGYIQEVEFE